MTAKAVKITDFSALDPAVQDLFALFNDLGIAHDTYEHPAIFTVEEGLTLNLPAQIPGRHGKSLFLTNKDNELWLVIAGEETRVDLKTLSDRLGVKRFSFAKPEVMVEVLGVTPGSATPFALTHDTQRRVKVVVEDRFESAESCVFHPLRNTHSTAIRVADLLRFLQHLGYEPHLLPLG